MMNILIVYATRQGQTEKIARRLATVLREHGEAPRLVDTDHPDGSLDLEHFQAALVCAPIPAGGYRSAQSSASAETPSRFRRRSSVSYAVAGSRLSAMGCSPPERVANDIVGVSRLCNLAARPAPRYTLLTGRI